MNKAIDLNDEEFFLSQAGARLKRARIDSNLTQSQVAKKCGISERKYRDIEHAVKSPTIDILLRACKHLEADPQVILFGAPPAEAAISSEIVAEIISGTLEQFAPEECDVSRALKIAVYAYDSSRAKMTPFSAELKSVQNLLQTT